MSIERPSRAARDFEAQHRGRHARGYLPHVDQPHRIQSITFRLHDAVPTEVVEGWQRAIDATAGRLATEARAIEATAGRLATEARAIELRRRIATYEDAGRGACWLAREEVGSMVERAIRHFDGDRYALRAWCVMPNHVHVVMEMARGWPLGGVVHSWKSYTAKQANRRLGRAGAFWMADYHDRFLRDGRHLEAAIAYVEQNPVAAGLVARAEDWRWSSARRRGAPGAAGAEPR